MPFFLYLYSVLLASGIVATGIAALVEPQEWLGLSNRRRAWLLVGAGALVIMIPTYFVIFVIAAIFSTFVWNTLSAVVKRLAVASFVVGILGLTSTFLAFKAAATEQNQTQAEESARRDSLSAERSVSEFQRELNTSNKTRGWYHSLGASASSLLKDEDQITALQRRFGPEGVAALGAIRDSYEAYVDARRGPDVTELEREIRRRTRLSEEIREDMSKFTRRTLLLIRLIEEDPDSGLQTFEAGDLFNYQKVVLLAHPGTLPEDGRVQDVTRYMADVGFRQVPMVNTSTGAVYYEGRRHYEVAPTLKIEQNLVEMEAQEAATGQMVDSLTALQTGAHETLVNARSAFAEVVDRRVAILRQNH